MKYTNLLDKISYLFKIIGSSSIYPIFLVIFILLTIVLISKKIKNNKVIIIMIINYLILFIITISNHYRSLSKVFDSIATNLFTNIYFPSTQSYLFTMLFIDIITITSVLNKKTDKAYKIANGICFFTTKFILALILEVVGQKKIDIFSKKSLFSNTNLVVLLEISISIFIIWLISLIVIYITNVIATRIMDKNEKVKEIEKEYLNNNITNIPSLEITETDEDVKKDFIPELDTVYAFSKAEETNTASPEEEIITVENINDNNYDILTIEDTKDNSIEEPKTEPEFIQTNITEKIADNFSLNDLTISISDDIDEPTIVTTEPKVDSKILLDRLLNNGIPLIEEEKNIENEKDNYTLNDYKTFNKMLKEIREMNNSNIINIDSRLDLRLRLRYSEEEYNLFKKMIKNYSN